MAPGPAPKPKEQRRNRNPKLRGEWVDLEPLEAPVLEPANPRWCAAGRRIWEAFRADPNLRAVRASTIEIHGNSEPPPHATVYFRGIDEQVGPMTKYALVEPYDNP